MAQVELDRSVPSNRWMLVPLAATWAFLWALVAIIENAGYIHARSIPRWQPLTLIGVVIVVIGVWLSNEIRRTRYLEVPLDPPQSWFVHQLRRLPIFAGGYIIAVYGLRHAIFYGAGASYDHLTWRALVPFEFVKASVFYCLWLGLVYGTLSMLQVREQNARLILVQKQLAESQLARLQAQLRPHFLFNTLNTISSLMQVDVGRADRVLARLGDLLRSSLGAAEASVVPLHEEIRILRLYADIMQERFCGRVTMSWEIDESTLAVPVPAMLLQPLLENAFVYGVEQNTRPGWIAVRASRDTEKLVIHIKNTGSTLPLSWRPGIGINNCRERLRVLYAVAAALDLMNDPDDGVIAAVSIPIAGTRR